jgi:dTMP kinase
MRHFLNRKRIKNGLFITFEGPEGSGKSTQIQRLQNTLVEAGYDVLLAREPGGTPLGEELRRLIKHFGGPEAVCPEAELLLFGASRAQLMRQRLEPHLSAGGVVLCDRFADSTTVYQGVARGLEFEFIEKMHAFTLRGRWPDLTLLLDIDVETGFRRTRRRNADGKPEDRFEAEPRAFHQRVRAGFLQLAGQYPQRLQVVDAAAAPDEVANRIREIVYRALG